MQIEPQLEFGDPIECLTLLMNLLELSLYAPDDEVTDDAKCARQTAAMHITRLVYEVSQNTK